MIWIFIATTVIFLFKYFKWKIATLVLRDILKEKGVSSKEIKEISDSEWKRRIELASKDILKKFN